MHNLHLAERLSRITDSAVRRLIVRSALNPMLWLCAIGPIPLLVAAYVFRDAPMLRDLLVFVSVVPMVVACLGFAGFAIWRPELLQSEDYQLRRHALTLIREKAGVINLDPASLEGIANPMITSPTAKPLDA